MFNSVLFGNIGAGTGAYIIITLTLLGSDFALISPSTVTATPSNITSPTTTTTTSAPIQLVTPSASSTTNHKQHTGRMCTSAIPPERMCELGL